MPLISVIVPVYKVEKYLCECIDSILNQTFTDFELILVDDGSPDNCPKICDEYAKKDSRIIVIHKENGGLSSARNAGLDIAKGKYISFVDSDDYVCCDFLQNLYDKIESNQFLDMVACNYSFLNEKHNFINSENSCNDFEVNKELYFEEPYHSAIFVVAWNKLYKSSIFNDLRYPIGKIHEDEHLIHKIIFKCQKIGYISKPLYLYRQRNDSIMGNEDEITKTLSMLDVYYERTIFYLSIGEFSKYNHYYKKAFILLFNKYKQLYKTCIYKKVFKNMKKVYKKRKKSKTESLFYLCPSLCLLVKRKKI